MRYLILYLIISRSLFTTISMPATASGADGRLENWGKPRIYYGLASFYANKFDGRETANGEVYDHTKLTAACNILPLGTWIRVTNLLNNKSVIVRTNDRLYVKMKRLVDLSRAAAEVLGYVKKGLTQVKVEVIEAV